MLSVRPLVAGEAAKGARAGRLLLPLAALATSIAAAGSVDNPWLLRLALAAALGGIVVALAARTPRALLLGLVLWLAPLGLVRRLLSGISPATGPDPLLLVEPLVLVVLVLAAHQRGAFRRLTPLSRTVLVLSILVLFGAFNPLQKSLLGGLSGLLFFVPLLAFWIGREFCDDRTLGRIFLLGVALAVPAALYGLGQVFVGFPSWDRQWIETAGPTSLNLYGMVRPFGTFNSSAEFGTYLGVALLCWLVFAPKRVFLPLALVPVAILVAGLGYQASRGIVVSMVATIALLAGARRRLPLAASVTLGAALLLALPYALRQAVPSVVEEDGSDALVAHQLGGLASPLDPEASSTHLHLELMLDGLSYAFREPLGLGIGVVTISGTKFGGLAYGTEVDPSNAAVALGLPGLIAYLVLLVLAFRTVYRLAVLHRNRTALAALAVLSVTVGQWLNGGLYAVALLPWLVLGWADRKTLEARAEATASEHGGSM